MDSMDQKPNAAELSLQEKMVALTSSIKNKYENILVEADNRVSYMNYSNRQ